MPETPRCKKAKLLQEPPFTLTRNPRYLPKDFSSDPNSIMNDHLAEIPLADGAVHQYQLRTEFKCVRKLAPDYSYKTSASTAGDEEMER